MTWSEPERLNWVDAALSKTQILDQCSCLEVLCIWSQISEMLDKCHVRHFPAYTEGNMFILCCVALLLPPAAAPTDPFLMTDSRREMLMALTQSPHNTGNKADLSLLKCCAIIIKAAQINRNGDLTMRLKMWQPSWMYDYVWLSEWKLAFIPEWLTQTLICATNANLSAYEWLYIVIVYNNMTSVLFQ